MRRAERHRGPRALRTRLRRRAALGAVAVVLAWLFSMLFASQRGDWSHREILDAIRMVESGDRDDVRDGDGGLAIGPYQIHRVYWQDALEAEPGLGGRYEDCRRRAYAEKVIAAYMRRHAADAWRSRDAQTIARVHNGGPTGPAKAATLTYWKRVREALER